jgi:hypothetical protein
LSHIFLTLGWTFIELLSGLNVGKREQADDVDGLRSGHLCR